MTTVDATPNAPGHVTDELPALLVGEADRETVRRVGSHLRTCADCRDDLVDAVISHATLRSAARHAPDVATGGRLLPVLADLPVLTDLPALIDDAVERTPERSAVDLSPVFAQIRAEAKAAAPAEPATASPVPVDQLAARRGRRTRQLLAAAAAVVVIGGGTAVAVTTLGSDDGRTVTVSAFGAGTVDATAQIGSGWVKLDASSLKRLPSDQFYEAWLLSGNGLMALGPLGGDGRATYSVPADVMAKYSTLQVTVQDASGGTSPSNTSVLRATL